MILLKCFEPGTTIFRLKVYKSSIHWCNLILHYGGIGGGGETTVGGERPAGKRLGGETTRAGNGFGAKLPGTVQITVRNGDVTFRLIGTVYSKCPNMKTITVASPY